MTEPIMHVDRSLEGRVDEVTAWTGGRVTIVGPTDDRLAEASAAIVGGIAWDATRFDLAPRLHVLARTGIGVDAIDLEEATKRGVLVTNTPDGPTVSTAEHTVALLFTVAKTIGVHQERLRRAAGNYYPSSTAVELDGLVIGLLGYGRISRRVARVAASVGMTVLAHDPFLTDTDSGDPATPQLVEFDELLRRSDVLSLHAPLTDATSKLFDETTFAKCKPGVIFLNAARGGLVDHSALLAALDSGLVGAAGLDVTEPEPLDPDHPLLHRDNVVVTPHVASATGVGRDRMLSMAIAQVMQVLDGGRPTNLVNPAAWTANAEPPGR